MTEYAIQTPAVEAWMNPEVQQIRLRSGGYLQELADILQSLGVTDVSAAAALPGGIMSACYILPDENTPLVAKLSVWSKPSEGEVMTRWKSHGAQVPTVHCYGIVPSTEHTSLPVSYMLMEAILDDTGSEAPTAAELGRRDLTIAAAAGKLVGQELAKMHQVPVAIGTFGAESGLSEFRQAASGWKEYLHTMIAGFAPALSEIGYGGKRTTDILSFIEALSFQERPVYLHNDPSPRNVLVAGKNPPGFYMIDPNPMVGDKHWDFAYILNARRYVSVRNNLLGLGHEEQLKRTCAAQVQYSTHAQASYEEASGEELDEHLLLACQLPRSLKRYAWFNRDHHRNPTELQITREVVIEQADRALYLIAGL